MIYVCSLNNKEVDAAALNGEQVIDNIASVYKVIASPVCTELIFKEDFLEANFNKSAVPQFIAQLKKINPKVKITLNKDYDDYFNVTTDIFNYLKSEEEFLRYCVDNTGVAMATVKKLIQKYKSDYNESLVSNNKIATMQLVVSAADEKVEEVLKKRDTFSSLYTKTADTLDKIVTKINTASDKKLDVEKFNGIKVDATNNFDKVLYIKEVSRVRFVDTLIFYIQEVVRALYNVPVRLLVIEANYADNRSIYYPTCKNRLTYTDVANSDIFVSGFQQKIIQDVLKNPNAYPYLIVLDRTMTNDIYLKGSKISTLYTASDIKDLNGFIPLNQLISYSADTLHINFIKNFDKLSFSEKVNKYSSMAIFKHIVSNILEGDAK